MNAPARLRDRLRALHPAAATHQTRLLDALQHRRAGELQLTAALQDRATPAAAWIGCDTPAGTIWLAPQLIDGAVARTGGGSPDAAALAATLEPLEPVILALEQVLGRELLPTAVAAAAGNDADLVLRVDAAGEDGAVRHCLLVALPPRVAPDGPGLPRTGTIALGGSRRIGVSLHGPEVAASRFATLAPGDLMLLGSAPLLVQTTATGGTTRLGALDLKRGSLTLQGIAEERTGTAASGTALRVAMTIEFDGGTLDAEEAAGLAEGSVLPLSVKDGTLTVRVLAGETLVGEGELVALGQGFGVLFTRVALAPAEPA